MNSKLETEVTPSPEYSSVLYSIIKRAIDSRQMVELLQALKLLKSAIHGESTLPMTELGDKDAQEYLQRGEVTIYVGTGTLGERMYLVGRELSMNEQPQQEYSLQYYNNFRKQFNLTPQQELRVKF